MMLSDFTGFLFPDFSDPIQSVFFCLMVSLTIGIIIFAQIYARENQWIKKWTGEANSGADKNLDIEHGSVTDLSHAVATAPEKLADVMPGLRDPHKLLPHIIHTLSDRPVSSTTELSTAKFALALADNIAYLY
ncbi:hypothetical protein [Alishewanella jeotgali]|uniref:hypothetical protein n=1 Tax=Alishewanella jeotgali TaxID=545533 RepID=UPI00111086FF|nr:hypothetical protein [Alishewanella jeotgali]